jgi:hypothetical protein
LNHIKNQTHLRFIAGIVGRLYHMHYDFTDDTMTMGIRFMGMRIQAVCAHSVLNATSPAWKMTVPTRSPAEVEARAIWAIVSPILVALCCGLCICLPAIALCRKYNKGCSLPEAQEQDEEDLLSETTDCSSEPEFRPL